MEVNYWAVLVCGAAAMVIGSLWYSPLLFAKLFMRENGMTEKDMKASGTTQAAMFWSYFLNLIAAFVTAYILAHFLVFTEAMTILDGLISALWIWIGFTAMPMLGMVLWEMKSVKYYLVVSGFHLVYLAVASMILVSWPVA